MIRIEILKEPENGISIINIKGLDDEIEKGIKRGVDSCNLEIDSNLYAGLLELGDIIALALNDKVNKE